MYILSSKVLVYLFNVKSIYIKSMYILSSKVLLHYLTIANISDNSNIHI